MDDYEDLLDEAMSFTGELADPAELDVAEADRYGWALKVQNRKLAALQESYDKRRAVLDAVFEAERDKLADNIQRLEETLKAWLLAWNAGDETKKSHTLPSGVKVSSTAGAIEMTVTNEEEFEAWVRENMPEHVETVEKIKKGEVKKAVVAGTTVDSKHDGKLLKVEGVAMTEDGAKVPGIELSKKPRSVKVAIK